ncbi:hypothetical protein DIPPA_59943, partial [Diplonema papillatum]
MSDVWSPDIFACPSPAAAAGSKARVDDELTPVRERRVHTPGGGAGSLSPIFLSAESTPETLSKLARRGRETARQRHDALATPERSSFSPLTPARPEQTRRRATGALNPQEAVPTIFPAQSHRPAPDGPLSSGYSIPQEPHRGAAQSHKPAPDAAPSSGSLVPQEAVPSIFPAQSHKPAPDGTLS